MTLTARLGSVLALAASHHNLLTTRDLHAAGLSDRQIARLVRDGIIERIIRGHYRVAGTRDPIQDIAVAVARHEGAAASHVTGLHLGGIDVPPPRRPQITLPPGFTSRSRLAILHRSPLERTDLTRRHRIPVTTVARSIVDAGEVLPVSRLAEVLDEAMTKHLTTIERVLDVADRLERAPGRIGSGRVRAALGPWVEPIQPGSPAEAATIRRIVDFGLSGPVTQHEIRDPDGNFVARVDVAWPDERVLREYDSTRYHGSARTEADERRRQRLESLGWSVGSIERQHLVPGRIDWLEKLAADLAAGRAAAA